METSLAVNYCLRLPRLMHFGVKISIQATRALFTSEAPSSQSPNGIGNKQILHRMLPSSSGFW